MFSVSRTASEVFDAPGAANVFRAVEDLQKALNTDNETNVQGTISAIVSATTHLNQQLVFYGNAQNRVRSASESAKKNAVQLQKDLSVLQETDLPAAILELNAAKVHHEAALMSQAKMPRSTLFDYLG
jgi:flagellin-like hook-associated protein FlgL